MTNDKKLHPKQLHNLPIGKHIDGQGLQLTITRPGTGKWTYRYQLNKRRREMGLGAYPEVGLYEARRSRDKYRALVREGTDPIEEVARIKSERLAEQERLRAEQQAAEMAAQTELERQRRTFTHCAAGYIRAHRRGWKNRKHARQWISTLRTYACPVIGDKPIADVDTEDLLQILNPIWSAKPETASRVRNRVENVLDYAAAHKWRDPLNPARWSGHLENLLAKPSAQRQPRHQPAMDYADLPDFISELEKSDAVSAFALRFLILTATRTGEVLGATWDEIDLTNALWTIPAERMKAGKAHEVPLSDAALAILREMQQRQSSRYIFPGAKRGRPLSNMALLKLMRSLGFGKTPAGIEKRGDAVPHGFRSSFREWAGNETPAPREVIEHSLAHQLKDKSEAAYHRGTLFPKRRRLMQAWSEFCCPTQTTPKKPD
ncbi:tyrosine-type recombinase/integrase [Granulosicoccaceae sp. 1_MG-2023]|nr:tyrosine-type recombinase/integrase [Granulosicoccaceae sp. 1_MG-2023]